MEALPNHSRAPRAGRRLCRGIPRAVGEEARSTGGLPEPSAGQEEAEPHSAPLRHSIPRRDQHRRSSRGTGAMQTKTSPANSSSTADREIVTTRLIDAPRELVYEAFTDARHVGHWFGPDGFTTTTRSMDVRPGGQWIFVMRGPDGTEWPNVVT